MINLSKSGDTIVFEFVNNGHYLQNGTIEVPVNSLSLVMDSSNMCTFYKADSGDIFISATYDELGKTKAEMLEWYEENMVAPQGGGGGGVTSGQVQTMIDDSVSGFADSVLYNSTSKYVEFYHNGTGGTKVYEFDASDFVIDGMVDDVRIETISGVSYLVIDFNTASGKEDIQIPLTDIFNPSDYYTKTEVDQALSGKQDTLSAGTNITIVDNVISATGGGGGGGKAVSAGTNISVTTGETADTINCILPIYLQGYRNLMYTSNDNTLKGDVNSISNSIFGRSNTIDKYGNNVNWTCQYNNIFGYGNKLFVDSSINTLWNNFICGEYNTISSSTISIVDSFALGGYNKGNNSKQALIGWYNNATNVVEMSFGQYNVSSSGSSTFGDSGNTLFSVGNGTANNARHNAFEIRQNGDIYITSGGTDIKLQDNLGSTIEISSAITSGDTNPVQGGAIYDKFDEVEQVTAAGLNALNDRVSEDEEVTAASLNALNDNFGGMKLVKLTQAQYDALSGNTDSNTLYVIVN